jgi:hypothetical protein
MGGFVVVALSTVFGGITGYFLANFLIWALKISKFEGGQGLFMFAFLQLAIPAGFVVGLLTVLVMKADFGDRLLRSAEILAGLAVAVGISAVLEQKFEDKGPKIDGSPLMIEVELRCWSGWTPSNALKARHAGILLQKTNPSTRAEASGDLDWKHGQRDDQRWVLAGRMMPLRITQSPWYVTFFMGKVEITIEVPVPKHPKEAQLFWSEWSSKGFVKAPNPEGLAYRYRIQKGEPNVIRSEGANAEDERVAKMDTLAQDAPIGEWTPVFESWGRWRTPSEVTDRAVEAVRGRPLELVPLLESGDFDTARHAMYAAAHLEHAPAALVRPVGDGAHWILKLIGQARAQSHPDDPDEVTEEQARDFYHAWIEAAKTTGEQGTAMRRNILGEVKAELDRIQKDQILENFLGEVDKQLEQEK